MMDENENNEKMTNQPLSPFMAKMSPQQQEEIDRKTKAIFKEFEESLMRSNRKEAEDNAK